MTGERRFEVNENGDGEAKEDGPTPSAPPPGQATPTAPLPRVGERKRNVGPRSRRPGRKAKPATTETEAPGLFFLFKPGVLLFLGAALLALLWAGGLFDTAPGMATVWPWESFLSGDDGGFALAWNAQQVYAILGAFFVAFFLVASLFPSSRGRGAAVLVVAALAFVPFWVSGRPMLMLGSILLGVGGGALVARAGACGGRALVFASIVLLAACLFFPVGMTEGYTSQAWQLGQELFGADADLGAALQEPGNALLVVLALLLVLLVLAWVGLGGRWAMWVGGVLLLVGVLAPLVLLYRDATGQLPEDAAWEMQLRVVTHQLVATLAAFLAFALPVAAGTVDAGRDDQS